MFWPFKPIVIFFFYPAVQSTAWVTVFNILQCWLNDKFTPSKWSTWAGEGSFQEQAEKNKETVGVKTS